MRKVQTKVFVTEFGIAENGETIIIVKTLQGQIVDWFHSPGDYHDWFVDVFNGEEDGEK